MFCAPWLVPDWWGHLELGDKSQQWGDGSVAGDSGVVAGEKAWHVCVSQSRSFLSMEADASVGWRFREETVWGAAPPVS